VDPKQVRQWVDEFADEAGAVRKTPRVDPAEKALRAGVSRRDKSTAIEEVSEP
jgi:hypothetical protein